MTIEITKDDEAKLGRLVVAGQFPDVDAALHEAISRLEETGTFSPMRAPVWPPGFLREVYLNEKEDELQFLEGNSLKLEGF